MELEDTVLLSRGYTRGVDDDRFYEHRTGYFEMDDGSRYGFKAVETDFGFAADHRELRDDPPAYAVRTQEHELEPDDPIPGLAEDDLEQYGTWLAVEHTVEGEEHAARYQEQATIAADD
ncbi:MAG: hypothetical protein SV186_02975 [Candidatus Nanohaloarchaea archaeon]|nr:hypothetical protein [Candidatus Nanohaloarchaea archaeon]